MATPPDARSHSPCGGSVCPPVQQNSVSSVGYARFRDCPCPAERERSLPPAADRATPCRTAAPFISRRSGFGFAKCSDLQEQRSGVDAGVIVGQQIERHCGNLCQQLIERRCVGRSRNIVAMPTPHRGLVVPGGGNGEDHGFTHACRIRSLDVRVKYASSREIQAKAVVQRASRRRPSRRTDGDPRNVTRINK